MASTSSSQLPAIPFWLASRLTYLGLDHGALANYFQHLALEATPKAKMILSEADQVADELGLDDELLDELVVGLGSERRLIAKRIRHAESMTECRSTTEGSRPSAVFSSGDSDRIDN